METKIRLNKMHFYAFHGVMQQEKVIGNEFEVNITLKADLEAASMSDDVSDTVNYSDVYDLVNKEMKIPSNLIEHVACRICRKIREYYPVLSAVEVSVKKMHPPVNGEMESAEVIITC
ncbi:MULTISPECIES: dihydroneopterin aldolase [Proteiniphilum]|jgi:dihydroneopterin aldolase|uniref:dihydroneopterin aldolase n=1 Tax=Proteiniphilum TaxID=294702 RepID=UPI001EEAE053|nr:MULTISPECIES: dihydroneopterin aldolase [Proteiniphilum]ULB34708.1 dihydroneopterin aldolase [Proteiniphilum propionicum]